MEGLRNWGQGQSFSAGFSPEIQTHYSESYPATHRNLMSEDGWFGTPEIPLFSDDQSLVSPFSRLGLSPNFQLPTQTRLPSSPIAEGGRAPVADGCFFPSNSVDEGLNNVGLKGGLPGLANYGGQNLGFAGTHRDVIVGPGSWDCGGAGVVSGFGGGIQGEPRYADWSLLLDTQLNGDDNDQRLRDHVYTYLLSKKLSSRRFNDQFPSLRPNQDGISRVNLGSFANGSVWKNSTAHTPNSQRNRQNYAKNKNPFDGISLKDMRGRLMSISKDQNGSKILQAKLEDPSEEEIEMVLCEVMDYVADLMKNQSGCYFVQKLFGVCSEEQRARIILAVTKNPFQLVDVCLNFNGARTMQKLLENLSTPEQIFLVISALFPGGVALAKDPNGQHVIRYCLISYPHEYHKHLLNEIASNCCGIANDKTGCCVLQTCVEHAHGEAKERLIKEIIKNALQLSEDPYGNYVVQHLLGLKMPQVTALLVAKLQGHFVALSGDKYGSNVVENFFKEAGKEHSMKIIMEIISSPNADSLLVDRYGNFVIQKALTIARGSDVNHALCNLIEMNVPWMRGNLYGKKILSWFKRRWHQHVV